MKHLIAVVLIAIVCMPVTAGAQLQVDAGDDVLLECASEDGAEYTLNGMVTDGDDYSFVWTTDPEVELQDDDTLTPTGVFPLGDTVVTLTAMSDGAEASDDVAVTVQDTIEPVVRARAEPFFLWPPNHKMREVEVRLRIRDRCTAPEDLQVELVSVESDEPDNGKGDGNTSDDIQDTDIGTDDREVYLRAERSGSGDGRVYTLTYRVTDAAGLMTYAEARVYVPHDYADLQRLLRHRHGDHDGCNHDRMDAICPNPLDAVEMFTDAVPDLGECKSERDCTRACRIWHRGCTGIVKATSSCLAAEASSLARLDALDCRNADSREESLRCRIRLKNEARETRAHVREDAATAAETCDNIARRCANACEDIFEPHD
jgi:hypothetical protein